MVPLLEPSLLNFKIAYQAERKVTRAEKALSKVKECLKLTERQANPKSITDEAWFMFHKLGLRMKAFLLLGISVQLSNLSCFFSYFTNCLRDITFILQVDAEYSMVL